MSERQTWQNDLPLWYCGDELHKAKLEKIQRVLKEKNLDALLFLKSEAVRYFTDFYAKGYRPIFKFEYLTLAPKGHEPVIGYISGSDRFRINLRCPVKDRRKLPEVRRWPEVIRQILVDYGLRNARIGTDILPFQMYRDLKKDLPGVEVVDGNDAWVDLTAVKHPREIEIIEHAARIADTAMEAAIDATRPGVKETEVSAEAEYAARMAGSEMNPFIFLVSSGVNSALLERLATEKRIEKNELVRLDIGAVYKGYTSEYARTVCVGSPGKKQKEICKIVYGSLQTAIKALKPGVTCSQIDEISRKVIEEAGYGEYAGRTGVAGTGHQIGYGSTAEPLIGPNVSAKLQPNMVIALEPMINLADEPLVGGVHFEENIVITDSGARVITHAPYQEELII